MDLEAEDARTLLGWNYYPAPKFGTPQAHQLRLLPHADTDVITLLFQRPGVVPHAPLQRLLTPLLTSPIGQLGVGSTHNKHLMCPIQDAMQCSKVLPCILLCMVHMQYGRKRLVPCMLCTMYPIALLPLAQLHSHVITDTSEHLVVT